jgi:hypothetical protein
VTASAGGFARRIASILLLGEIRDAEALCGFASPSFFIFPL